MNQPIKAPSKQPAGGVSAWYDRLVNALLNPMGRQVVHYSRAQVIPEEIPDPHLYHGPEDFHRLYHPWRDVEDLELHRPEVATNTMLSPQKRYFLRQLVRLSLAVEGDIFEAGTGSGGSARLILDILQSANSTKRIWSLDTFEGYQKIDVANDGSHVKIQGCRCASFEDVTRLLASEDHRVRLIRGLIPATLSQVHAEAISFAHIDVNLHEPTLAATEFVLARLSAGGIVLFDDYAWPATYAARAAIDEACRPHGFEVIVLPHSTQAFLLKPGNDSTSPSGTTRSASRSPTFQVK